MSALDGLVARVKAALDGVVSARSAFAEAAIDGLSLPIATGTEVVERLQALMDGDARAGGGAAGSRPRRSGWDGPFLAGFAAETPKLGYVSPGRAVHILDGDGDGRGGGHRFGTGLPGKTEFPERRKKL